jgi:hypothetical protein
LIPAGRTGLAGGDEHLPREAGVTRVGSVGQKNRGESPPPDADRELLRTETYFLPFGAFFDFGPCETTKVPLQVVESIAYSIPSPLWIWTV